MDKIIQIENLGKKYILGQHLGGMYQTFGEKLTSLFRKKTKDSKDKTLSDKDFWAVRNISFDVKVGERVGVIGRNGAGKSTILKLLSRITEPTEGKITLRGRVASLLEVGTGFHGELTGRENIFLNGSILGMRKNEITRKFDQIVDFSGVEKFLDTPVKRYSSGMYVRLAFAVAAHLDPEILIVDEVLAVGDIEFQKKCLGKMRDLTMESNKTILLVSHNIAAIRDLCNKCILLEQGQLKEMGDTNEIINKYLNLNYKNDSKIIEFQQNLNKEFQLLNIFLSDDKNKLRNEFECDEPIIINFTIESRIPLPKLYSLLSIKNNEGIDIWVSDTYDISPNILDTLERGKYMVKIKLPPRILGHGDYIVYLNFATSWQNVDSPQYTCRFILNDHSTQRGNNRLGFISNLLKWEIRKIS